MLDKILKIYDNKKEVINYLIFGALTTIINLFVYFILTSFFLDARVSLELQIANIISWIAAVIFAYVTNRKYVFNSKNDNKVKEIKDFFIARFATLIMDMIIMYLGVNVLKFNDKLIKIISQGIVIVSNYVLSKVFVFKKKGSSESFRMNNCSYGYYENIIDKIFK